ncbi:MAG: hypothetical protein M3R63_24185 [Actinomycetota bacterium]|nr:hypothetical protein [Actinomycetota bacterium]
MVVVIAFLIGIVRALNSIDAGLFEAASAVQGIGGDAAPLPGSIQVINSTLGEIDTALQPIQGQAGEIGSGLEQITNSLQQIDASLKDTDVSLVDTSGSLVDTSGTLVDIGNQTQQISGSLADTSNVLAGVRNMAGQIEGVLEESQNIDSLGTAGIPVRVGIANSVLGPAQSDTLNITGGLVDVNRNLTSICTSIPLTVTGIVTQTGC